MKEGSRKGFSLVEVLVVIVILSIIILISSDSFVSMIKGMRRETGSTVTEMKSLFALNVIRFDVEHAGYGLFTSFSSPFSYSEVVSSPGSNFNDSPSSIPRPILSGNNIGFNGSDHLVVKSILCANNSTCEKWTYVKFGERPRSWDFENLKLKSPERVVVIRPGDKQKKAELIVTGEGSFFTIFSPEGLDDRFKPKSEGERYIIYGVDPDTDLRMPFNRADFFISRPSTGIPKRCAPNTGILYKAVVRHSDGRYLYLPILDCVADFQVIFGLDKNGDGFVDSYEDDISSFSSKEIREKVKEVRVYILTHDGKRDRDYLFDRERVYVGEFEKGRDFDLSQIIGPDYRHFRWRIYSISLKPKNLL